MKCKKSIIILILAVFLLSISGVCASEMDDMITSDDTDSIGVYAAEDIEDNLQTTGEKSELTLTDSDVLGSDSAKYSDLESEIAVSGPVTLKYKNYAYDVGAAPIIVREADKVIDGNGAVIDMAGSSIRAFAVYSSYVTIKNLTIINANYGGSGGAIYFESDGNVTNCNFVNNTAGEFGGAIRMSQGSVSDCNFISNSATAYSGGAVSFNSIGTVTNCNFTGNTAKVNGGAVNLLSGTVSNCNFVNNTETRDYGGAIDFEGKGTVANCTFTNNVASQKAGAVYFNDESTLINCNFTDNTVSYDSGDGYGGAAYFKNKGNVLNCNFIHNTASRWGGAVFFETDGSMSNCNFTHNSAGEFGGAAYFMNIGDVSDCNFIQNTASKWGGAIFFSKNGYVSKCSFIDNAAPEGGGAILSMEYLLVTADTCIFKTDSDTTYNTLILSPILNIDDFTIYSEGRLKFDLRTNRGEVVKNGNLSISVYYKNNDSWVGNYTCLSGETWVVDLPAGLYYVIFNTEYAQFTPVNRAMTIVPNNTFYALNYEINIDDVSSIYLTNDFYFDPDYDGDFVNGIVINRPITINGNGYTINANGKANIFNITRDNVVLENITFANANTTGSGGAVLFVSGGEVINCNFINNTSSGDGGAVMIVEGSVKNCNFINNSASGDGGAVWTYSGCIEYCDFINNSASGDGGAVWIYSRGLENCSFADNSASRGGAVHFNSSGNVTNCNFTGNAASLEGGAVHFNSSGTVMSANFNNNTAGYGGGALYFYRNGIVKYCDFTDNNASKDGGSIYMHYHGNVTNSIFINNAAERGGSIFSHHWNAAIADTCIFKTTSDTTYKTVIHSPTLDVVNFTTFYGSGDKLTFELKTRSGEAVNNGNISISLYFKNNGSWVGNYSFLSGEKWTVDLPIGIYYAIFNTEYAQFAPVNRTVTIAPINTFWALDYIINAHDGLLINLAHDFYFDSDYDANLVKGIVINRPITLNGNGHTINANGKARIFNIVRNNVVLENIAFVNANATGGGGAVCFSKSGRIINCNFTNNSATCHGGAVEFNGTGDVTNCSFTDNVASQNAGAVYFASEGNVANSNFNGNLASRDGGALYFASAGNMINCDFNDNSASGEGGAVYFASEGNVAGCNFNGNSASKNGGALYFASEGNVTGCNFTGNNATFGSAIEFASTSANKSVSNSCFLKNRANTKELQIRINKNYIVIIFTGYDNLLNAIYSRNDEDVTFTNVTYWGSQGITNTGSSAINPSRSRNEIGQNITASVVVNDELVLNEVRVTDEQGMVILIVSVGENYFISIRHDTDSYYTKAEKVFSNMAFKVNVASQTTHNMTVNITAKSNIYREFMEGELLFILPNGENIAANYAGNGTWWALHTFDDYGDYQVNATCIGLDNVAITNATISVSKIPTEISVVNETVDLFVGDCVGAGATLTPADAGNLTFTSSDVSVVKVEDGKIMAVGEGTAIITVSFAGRGDYAPCESRTITVNVKRVATCMTVENITAHPGDEINISIDMLSDDELPVNAKVNITLPDGKTTAVEIINGKANVTWKVPQDFDDGNYSVAASYNGDDRYMPCVGEGGIKIIRYASKVTISPIADAVYGNDVTIKYSIENRTNVTVRIDGVSDDKITVTNDTITVAGLDAGTYTITVLNNESSRNYGSCDVKTFNVGRMTTSISAEAITTSYNANKNLIIALKDSAGKALTGLEVTVNLNGAKTFITDNNGQIKIQTKALTAKVYTAKITFEGNTNYGNSTKDVSVTVKKAANPLKVKGKTVKVKFKKLKKKAKKLKVKKVVKFTKKGVGTLTFKKVKGNKKIKVNKKTGKVTIKKGLKKGTYKVKMKIRAKGNSNYNASGYKKVTFKIKVK